MKTKGSDERADTSTGGTRPGPAKGISRRRLIGHGIGAGAAIAVLYVAPSLKSLRPSPAYAAASVTPEPSATPTASALPTPTPVPGTVTTITFIEGESGPVGTTYAAAGTEFPNSKFHTVPSASPPYPFVDGHGAVVDFDVYESFKVVILFSPGVNWAEVDGFMVKSGSNPDPSWQMTGYDTMTCDIDGCVEGALIADSGALHGTPFPTPASSFMKSTLAFAPPLPAPGAVHGVIIEANSPFALDTVRFAR